MRGIGWWNKGYVEFLSTSFIRGTTFNNAIVILDESQNCTMHELDTIITRIGHTSKFFLCGDYRQVDLTKKNDKSGLLEFSNHPAYNERVYRD
jgi:phosphate starvation-inducible protein PhoH